MIKQDLSRQPTKVLLKWLKHAHASGASSSTGIQAHIKTELWTREHVLNKQDAKALRQKKAKERKSQGRPNVRCLHCAFDPRLTK